MGFLAPGEGHGTHEYPAGVVPLYLLGINPVAPENYVCMVFQAGGLARVVPIWSQSPEAMVAKSYVQATTGVKRRAVDALIELFDSLGGVETVEVVSYHEGVFVFRVTATTGQSVEVSATDAIIIAHHYDLAIVIDSDLLARVAVFSIPEDVKEYLGVEFSTPAGDTDCETATAEFSETSASGDPQADADFEAMMRSLGMDDDDFPDPPAAH